MFRKVLIANRGEIAIRIIRACRELGVQTVAVHSEADAGALHVRFADEAVCIGPAAAAKSYLHIPALISAAEITAADAIHPGYGFLSENAEFAQVVERCGLHFIGPSAEAMTRWGDKLRARENAAKFGLPLLSGSVALLNAEHAESEAKRVGYPVMVKARGGGGGRGMRIVRNSSEIRRAFESATSEAMTAFRNPELYLERFVERPKHIEFQALADTHGQVWTLGERECSLQRKNQKLVEEAPSPNMTEELRADMGERIRRAIVETGYTSLGTLEFLMDEYAGAGRAPGDRNGHRGRPGRATNPRRRWRKARPSRHARLALSRARHRVPNHGRGSEHVCAVAGQDHRVPPARGRRRARRFGGFRWLDRAVAVRLVARQGDSSWADARGSDRAHAPRAR
jgi:acetyl-CoA carboxylase, biotin carboxylase subunit